MPSVTFPKVTIANAAQLSTAADLADRVLCALHMPAAFTGVAVKFKGAPLNAAGTGAGAYNYIKDSGGVDLSVTVAPNSVIQLDPTLFLGVRFLKIESQTAEGGSRDVYLGVREG